MNKPTYIIVRCSATYKNKDLTEKQIDGSHIARSLGEWRCHCYIRRDGRTIPMQAGSEIGTYNNFIIPNTNTNYNRCSTGIYYGEGLDKNSKTKDTRADAQKKAMRELVQDVCHRHDIINVLGHRDISSGENENSIVKKRKWVEEYPCFSAKSEFTSFLPPVTVRP